MKKNQDQPADAAELRRRAEERLSEKRKSKRSEAGDQRTSEDTARLVHELQVHQIELEIQNEELQQARTQAEALLAQYTDLYDFAPTGYLTLDREGAIRLMNSSGARLLGVERSRLVNRRFGLFVAKGDRRAFSDFLEKVFASQAKECCEVTLPQEGSQPLVVQIEGTPSEDGQECLAVVLDITERKRTEKALRETNEYLENLVNHANAPIIVWDPQLRITRFNHAFESLTGRKAEDMTGGSLGILFPPGLVESTMELIKKTLRGEHWETVEIAILHLDGSVRTVLWNSATVLAADGKTPVAAIAQGQDITARKQAEKALRESEEKYRQVVENASEAIFVVQGGRIVFLNPTTCAMIGYSGEELMARPFPEFIHPDDRDMVLERHRARLKGEEQPSVYPFRVVRADGAVRWGELSAILIDWQGEPATLNLVSDITERRQAELERERLLERQIVLNRISLALGSLTDLPAIFRTLHGEVRTLLDADAFFVSKYHKDTGLITALFAFEGGVERDVSSFPPIPLAPEGKGMQSQVLRTGRPLSVPNWVEGERKMQTVYHIAPDGTFTSPPPEDEREGCTKSALLVPMMLQGEPMGVLQVQSNRPNAHSDEDADLLAGLANVAAISIQNALLVEEIRRAAAQVRQGLEGTIQAVALTTEMRDPYTAGHQERVTRLACAIAEKMGLGEERVEGLRVAGLLHDVGKVSVPAEILSKPTTLTPAEFSLVKTHPQTGYDILKGINFPWPVAEIVREHHERLDGSGYPRGLKGEAISLEAKILAVADVVEAMVSHRPYRPALGVDKALGELEAGAGTLYDPEVVKVCLQLFHGGYAISTPQREANVV